MFARFASRRTVLRALSVAAGAGAGAGVVVHSLVTDRRSGTRFPTSAFSPRGAVALAAVSGAEAQAVASSADKLYAADEKIKLLRMLDAAVGDDIAGSDTRILWRCARACHDVKKLVIAGKIAPGDVPGTGESTDKAKVVELLARRALALAEEAVRRSPSDFACQKWAGIALSGVGDHVGTKAKIGNAFKIREHFERAVQLNPKDATSKYLLGRWCFDVASISWIERRAAQAIFDTPPTCNYEEALSQFQAAEATEPGFYVNNALMIAKTYNSLGLKDDAKVWCRRALEMKATNEDDRDSQKEAREILARLG